MQSLPSGRIPDAADIVLIGTGFASTFFLSAILPRARPGLKIVVLERGGNVPHAKRIERRKDAEFDADGYYRTIGDPNKKWRFSTGFGGSANCWTGNTPRMLPADFEMRTRFGQGMDWPFSYDALEPYYTRAEEMMQISGARNSLAPSTSPYPLPPHRPSLPEVALSKAWPGLFGPMPTARASRATPTRPQCCGNGVCNLCPVQAKFTIMGDLSAPYDDPRVSCVFDCEATAVLTEGGAARAIAWRAADGNTGEIRADQIVLGANGIFNATLLKQSGDTSRLTGRRLHEQLGITGRVYLDGMDSFQGSTYVTGIAYPLYADEERRRTTAAALIETRSVGQMRLEAGSWRQVLPFRLVIEDLPDEANAVTPGSDADPRSVVHFGGIGDYARKAMERADQDLARIFASLPVDWIELDGPAPTESHIQGTTVIGHDPAHSVTDQDGLHHRWRDLRVLGSSLFPTGAPANPTLTLSAHALRAGDRAGSL